MHGPPDAAGTVEDLARVCTDVVLDARPDGPYFLLGHSFGGVVMYETARQLAARGGRIGLVVLADVVHPAILTADWKRRHSVRYRAKKLLSRRGPSIIAWRVRRLLGRSAPAAAATTYLPGTDEPADFAAAAGPVVVFATRSYLRIRYVEGPDLGWAPLLDAGGETHVVPGNHDTMLGEPHVGVLAGLLDDCLRRAQAGIPFERVEVSGVDSSGVTAV
jgi:thioesterase domain-containing protein